MDVLVALASLSLVMQKATATRAEVKCGLIATLQIPNNLRENQNEAAGESEMTHFKGLN